MPMAFFGARRVVAISSLLPLALLLTIVPEWHVQGHPLCYIGDVDPSQGVTSTFCPNEEPDGFCCDAAQEAGIQTAFEASGATGTCGDLYQEVLCAICHPYSSHLFERLDNLDGLTMTNAFCDSFFEACETQLSLPLDYCDIHTGGDTDQYWSYPLVIDESFNTGQLIPAFPDLLETELPTQPMEMRMTPDGSTWWVAGLEGEIKQIDANNPTTATTVLDISDKIVLSYEQGLISFAFCPSFHSTGIFYISYTTPGEQFARNRLSRMTYDSTSPTATYASEEILITTSDKASSVHSAGWVGFKPSSYVTCGSDCYHLYWSNGDGGPQNDVLNRAQNVSEYHGSIIRIDVSPYCTGYRIPSSNPFANGGGLAEICAWGFRNPFRCGFDRLNDDLYCADVGHLSLESVDIIECGNNYGWRRFEAERCHQPVETEFPEDCANVDRSPYTFPIYSYCHPTYSPADGDPWLVNQDVCGDRTVTGLAVIGGFVYRGQKYNDLLQGHYIFAEHWLTSLHNVYPTGGGNYEAGTFEDDSVPRIVSFAEDNSGEMYFIGYQGNIWELPCGSLCTVSGTPSPISLPVPTPSPVVVATPAPTPSPVTPDTPAPAPMPSPVTPATPAPTPSPVQFNTPSPTISPTVTEAPVPGTGDDDEDNDDGDGDPCNPDEDELVEMQLSPAEVFPEYKGCWNDRDEFADDRTFRLAYYWSNDMTALVCDAFCRSQGADVFALQYGSECHCGDSRDADYTLHGEGVCDMGCSGDSTEMCGGYLTMDVYYIGGGQATPAGSEYVGCRSREGPSRGRRRRRHRKLRSASLECRGTMTIQICERYCRLLGSVIYSLQDGHECFCGRRYSTRGYDEGTCDTRCDGDSETTCGGSDGGFSTFIYVD